MMILDQGKQATGDIAKDELNQSGSTNATVQRGFSGARGSMDNLTMMAGSSVKRRLEERDWREDTKTVFLLTSEEEIEEAHKEVSSLHLSSVVWNQLSSSCSQFQEENPCRYSGSILFQLHARRLINIWMI